MKTRCLTLAALLVLAAVTVPAEVTVVAVGGEQAPDGNGLFFDFDIPSMNGAGQVAFVATLGQTTGGNTDNSGIFRGTGAPGSLTVIVRRGNPSPDANGNFALFDPNSEVVINDSGQVAFIAGLSGTFGGGLDDTGLFRGDGTPGALTQIVRAGQALPGGGLGGTVPNLRSGGLLETFAFNDMNQVAFNVTGLGIFETSGGPLTSIARSLQPIPDGNGMFTFPLAPALNGVGQVAFADLSGIYRGDGATILSVVRTGNPTPDGNGMFSAPFGNPAVNDMGDVAFFATLTGTSGGTTDNQGIFLRRGAVLMAVVRRGQAAPDGNGRFLDLNMPDVVALNEAGQVAFVATLTATAGGTSDNTGLFRGDGNTLTQIVRTGDRAPDGTVITSVGRPALNDAGQVAFLGGFVPPTGGTPHAILLYDDERGLLQAVRTGDALLGSRIGINSNLMFVPSTTFRGKRRSGLNEQGRVVFRFDLDDGRRGIAIADPLAPNTPSPSPTPTSIETVEPSTTPTPSPTNIASRCIGDCNSNGTVVVNELIQLLTFSLGSAIDCSACLNGLPAAMTCPSGVTVAVVIDGVNNALTGCPTPPSRR